MPVGDAVEACLPPHYDFQLEDLVSKAYKLKAKHIGLQFPDGLLCFATTIASIIKYYCSPYCAEVTIMSDVVYGACCIDDLTAKSLGIDFMVHFGHSCLVPNDQTVVKTLYILVTIHIDVDHLISTIDANFDPEAHKLALQGTVQFSYCLNEVKERLQLLGFDVYVPQCRPLGPGETLGCTAPRLDSQERVLVFVSDGRFHLEAAQMANSRNRTVRYDPYNKRIFEEKFDFALQKRIRNMEIAKARRAKTVGLILGTLGRQGSVGILESIRELLQAKSIDYFFLLISEISNDKLKQLNLSVDAWVQVACPRLSIDWGESYDKPLLSSYEAFVAWGEEEEEEEESLPMDYYSNEGGKWANYTVRGGYGGSQDFKFWHMKKVGKEM